MYMYMFLVRVSYQHQHQHTNTHKGGGREGEKERRREGEKERRREGEKGEKERRREGEKEVSITAGPFWGINTNYSYRRASAGELILHYITVGPSPGIKNVILFARMASCLAPVVTTEAHLAYAGSRIHSSTRLPSLGTTAQLSVIHAHAFFCDGSKHAASICLGTIKSLANVHLERVEKLPFLQNLRISFWFYDMEGHAKLCSLISYFHHVCEYTQYFHVWNTSKQCRFGLFRLRFWRRS